MSDGVYEVYAVAYGTRMTTASEVFLNFHTYQEPDRAMRMDYFFWVARNDERVVLVDTGFSPREGRRRRRAMHATFDRSLAALGLDVSMVDQVVITHAHYDHIGGLAAVAGADVVMSEREFRFWQSPMARREQFAHSVAREELTTLGEVHRSGHLTLFTDETRPAAGIQVIEVGGHTPGQSIVTVATEAGRVVLAADALHYYEELELDRPFSVVADLEAMYGAFDLLGELDADPHTCLVAGHDPLVRSRFEALDEDARVVRLTPPSPPRRERLAEAGPGRQPHSDNHTARTHLHD